MNSSWQPTGGLWQVENGELSATGTSNNQVNWVSNLTVTDFTIEAKIKALNNGQFWFGFQFRATSQSDGYGVWLTNVENALRFTKITSIGNFQVIKDFPYTPVKDTWYTLKVIAKGSNFDFYLNTQYLGSATDTSFSSGKVGLLIWHATQARFDDVKVTEIKTTNYLYNEISELLLAEYDEEGRVVRSYVTDTDEYGELISITLPTPNSELTTTYMTA